VSATGARAAARPPGAGPRTAIVTGASSGIGRALAVRLAHEGWRVGLAARRVALLESLREEIGRDAVVQPMDQSDAPAAMEALRALIARLGGADLVILNAGTGHLNAALDWEPERETVAVNVTGFAALAQVAMRHFEQRGGGHLVSISSIAALHGYGGAPAYGASKAFISHYMDALRHRCARRRLPIAVTDVLPGFVDTAMAQGDHVFWVASADEVARQILDAVRRRRKRAIVTRRWILVAWAYRLVPDWIYDRLG
jgi:short-subunit dehydrogenase